MHLLKREEINSGCVLLPVLMIFFVAAAFGQEQRTEATDPGIDYAVVTASNAVLRRSPSSESLALTTLKENTKVVLLESGAEDWYKVADLGSLSKGWVKAENLEVYLSADNALAKIGAGNCNCECSKKSIGDVKGSDSNADVSVGTGTGLGVGSLPDRELKILSKPRALYTITARENNVTGTVTLEVTFLADGTIGDVSVVKGLPHGLSQKAVDAARQILFQPQIRNGLAENVTKNVQYDFTIY